MALDLNILSVVTGAVDVEPELGMSRVRGLEKGVWCVKMRLNGIKLGYLRNPMPSVCDGLGLPSFCVASAIIGKSLDPNA